MEWRDDVDARDCTFAGVNLVGAAVEPVQLTDVTFDNCDLSAAGAREASLVRVAFTGCRASAFDLAGAHVADVTFTDCKLDDANFRMVDGLRSTSPPARLRRRLLRPR